MKQHFHFEMFLKFFWRSKLELCESNMLFFFKNNPMKSHSANKVPFWKWFYSAKLNSFTKLIIDDNLSLELSDSINSRNFKFDLKTFISFKWTIPKTKCVTFRCIAQQRQSLQENDTVSSIHQLCCSPCLMIQFNFIY